MGAVRHTRRWAARLLTALAFAPTIAVAGSGGGQAGAAPPVLQLKPYTGKQTSLSLQDLARKTRRLEEFRGRAVIVHFWATWCPPCRTELPSLEQLRRELGAGRLEILAVAVDNRRDVANFMAGRDLGFTVLVDQYGEAMHAFRVKGVPTSFILDSAGRPLGRIDGMRDWNDPGIRAYVDSVARPH